MSKIGIVLATYNGEKYLSQMLDSLLAQIRPADFIVAVDDGSTDNTASILESYKDRLPLQIHRFPKNQGHRAAFAKSLELAQPQLGENDMIALADQDDIWLPQKLQLLEDSLQQTDANLVFGDAQLIDGEGKIIGESWRKTSGVPEHLSLRAILTGFTNVTGCMTLFKAKLLQQILPIPEQVAVHDQWITFCASAEAKNDNGVKSINVPIIQYRIHGQNAIGLGQTHTWTGNLKLNLQWAKMILTTPHFKALSSSDQKFLKKYIAYVNDLLSKPFIPQYLVWIARNVRHIYPHVKGIPGFISHILYGIVGAPIITKFSGKK
jgi:glycosyltransferase involved in cell wall biosynthesis